MRIATARRSRRAVVAAAIISVAASLVVTETRSSPARAAPANLTRFAAVAAPLDPAALVMTDYRTPNGWQLRPAGTQIDTPRAPTGVAVSPDAKTAVAVNSGMFDEQLVVVDAATLTHTLAPSTDLYMGAAIDEDGNVWVSTGNRNRVYQYRLNGPTAEQVRGGVALIPGSPDNGIPVVGYPGNMTLGPDGRLYVAGNLSVPQPHIQENDATAGPCPNGAPAGDPNKPPICSVVNVLDVSDPFAGSISDHLVPVGRDAYGLALNAPAGKLYVTNWADETNPARAGGSGTLSVVDVSTPGAEHEVQAVPVGHHPTGIALSPNGSTLFVANSADDTLTKIALGSDGLPTGTSTIDVRATPGSPLRSTPLALSFSADGKFLFVALAGQNAIEVRGADGAAISQQLPIRVGGQKLTVPHTYIPTGWYPEAIATSPRPSGGSGSRLYVANLKGIGAGPGMNGDAEPFNGSRTEGTLSVIDVPADAKAAQFNTWTKTVVDNNNLVPIFSTATDPAKNACVSPGHGITVSLLCDAARGKIDPRQFHVLYIVKENKTFDQYFGDINAPPTSIQADADPSWLLYGYPVTTNQHRIAATWTIMDHFWSDADVSVTGHSWTSAGYATEANEITWNPDYDQGIRGNRSGGQYDGNVFSPQSDPDISAQEGEILEPEQRLVDVFADSATNALGATFRIYSDDVNGDSPAKSERVPLSLWGLGASPVHHGRDLDFPDTDRAAIFLDGHTVSHAWTVCGVPCTSQPNPPPETYQKEIGLCGAPNEPDAPDAPQSFCSRPGASPDEYEKYSLAAWTKAYQDCTAAGGTDPQCQQAMPNFLYMALPIDHTLGFNPNTPTPASMVANNDLAVGQIVQALSNSPFWKNTLVMITEDDTQLAGDHVDAHRTFLLTAGGLARQFGAQGQASHQEGSFPSVLKTVEVLFRLPPISIFDRGAVPLHDVVVAKMKDRNNVKYEAVQPAVEFQMNPGAGILARISSKLNWNGVDLIDQDVLNDLIYHYYLGWPLKQRDFAVLRAAGR